MTRVLVLGRHGQLAQALASTAWPGGWQAVFAGRAQVDLTHADGIAPFLDQSGTDVVINTAAYTAVDQAESESQAAFALNAEAPGLMAEACARAGRLLLHLSTDYVFGGEGDGPFVEDAAVAPVNVYGRSKAEGELRVIAQAPDAGVIRTAWLMSPATGFIATIKRRAQAGESLRVVCDQRGNPTQASDLAQALVRVAQDRLSGRGQGGWLHAAGPETASWFDLARAALAPLGLEAQVKPVFSNDYPAIARRPRDSRLDVTRLAHIHAIELSPWTHWVA